MSSCVLQKLVRAIHQRKRLLVVGDMHKGQKALDYACSVLHAAGYLRHEAPPFELVAVVRTTLGREQAFHILYSKTLMVVGLEITYNMFSYSEIVLWTNYSRFIEPEPWLV